MDDLWEVCTTISNLLFRPLLPVDIPSVDDLSADELSEMCTTIPTAPTFFSPFEPSILCQALDDFAKSSSVEDTDVWSVVYGPLCFIVGFRLLFYIALITKHSGSRK